MAIDIEDLRLGVYRGFAATGRAPDPAELAERLAAATGATSDANRPPRPTTSARPASKAPSGDFSHGRIRSTRPTTRPGTR
jgi:hypothetical protein